MLGSCLTSATVMSFYFDGSTTWISGVINGDMVTLHGNAVSQYVEAPIGVFGQLVTSPPVLNTAFPSGGTYYMPQDKVDGKEVGSCLGDLYSVNWMEVSGPPSTPPSMPPSQGPAPVPDDDLRERFGR